jgi:hypothetical protein
MYVLISALTESVMSGPRLCVALDKKMLCFQRYKSDCLAYEQLPISPDLNPLVKACILCCEVP